MKNSVPKELDQTTPETIEEAPQSTERGVPDLSTLIEQTEEMVVKHEQLNGEEIAEKVNELRVAISRLDYLKNIRTKRVDRIKKIKNPYAGLNVVEELSEELKNELVRLELLTPEESEQLVKIEGLLDKLEKMKNPTAKIKQRQLDLLEAESRMLSRLSVKIALLKTAFEDRRDRVLNKSLNLCNKRAGVIGQFIQKLKSDPMVVEKFETEETLTKALGNLTSATDRQSYAIDNLSQAMNSDKVRDVLLGLFDSSGKEQRQHIYRLRADLVKAVKDERILDPSQVAPWKTKTGKKYESLIDSFKDRNFLDKLRAVAPVEMMEALQDVVDIDSAMRVLYGRESDGTGYDKNRKRIKKNKSQFWRAFEQKQDK